MYPIKCSDFTTCFHANYLKHQDPTKPIWDTVAYALKQEMIIKSTYRSDMNKKSNLALKHFHKRGEISKAFMEMAKRELKALEAQWEEDFLIRAEMDRKLTLF